MDVSFRDSRTQRLFNQHDRMIARYGETLARKAATRMEVLAAAPDLSLVPSVPPIRCQEIGDDSFTVDLDPQHRLRFVGVAAQTERRGGKPLKIRSVEVLGIERAERDGHPWRPC